MIHTNEHTVVRTWRALVATFALMVTSILASANPDVFSPETSPLPEPLLPAAASAGTTATAPLLIYDAHLVSGMDPFVRVNLDELLATERVKVVNEKLVWPQEESNQNMRREGVARQWAYLRAMAEEPITDSRVIFLQTDKARFIDERHTTSTLEPLIAKYLPIKPSEPAQRGGSVVRTGQHVIHRRVLQYPSDSTSQTLVRFEIAETPAQRDVAGDHDSSIIVQNLIVWPQKYHRRMTAAKRGEMVSVPDNYLEFYADPRGRITKAITVRAEPGEPTMTETALADYTDAHNFPTSITVERRRDITPELRAQLERATTRAAAQITTETTLHDDGTTQSITSTARPPRFSGVAGELGLLSRMTVQLRDLRPVDANTDVVRMIPAQTGDVLVNAMMAPERERPLAPGERVSLDFLKEK